jgi:hypothetical protein
VAINAQRVVAGEVNLRYRSKEGNSVVGGYVCFLSVFKSDVIEGMPISQVVIRSLLWVMSSRAPYALA